MTADAVVRARIDKKVKDKAARVLEQMGLTVSDAIRLMMIRTASEKALPFQVKVPNTKTRAAMKEADAGHLKTARNSRQLLADLNADD
jgi:DNA-damage-inducible protein J